MTFSLKGNKLIHKSSVRLLQYAGVNILRNENNSCRKIQQFFKIKIVADNVPEKRIFCCFILSIQIRKIPKAAQVSFSLPTTMTNICYFCYYYCNCAFDVDFAIECDCKCREIFLNE